jgi:hypothetical protein
MSFSGTGGDPKIGSFIPNHYINENITINKTDGIYESINLRTLIFHLPITVTIKI